MSAPDPSSPRHDPDEGALAQAWLRAASAPAVVDDLLAVFADADAAVRARGPACWASGRCCNFRAAGHLLYTTGLEAAYTFLGTIPSEPRAARQPHEEPPPAGGAPQAALSLPVIARAQADGLCPYQSNNLCSVHSTRPLGCRVYFCTRGTEPWQHELTERLLTDLQRLHTRHQIPYRYAEWRTLLAAVARAQ